MITLEPLDDAARETWRGGLAAHLVERRVGAGIPSRRAAHDVDVLLRDRLDERPPTELCLVIAVLADGSQVGTSWIVGSAAHSPILVDLDVPPQLAVATVEALVSEVRSRGATGLEVPVLAGDGALASAVAELDAPLVATHMQLDLAAPRPNAPRVLLVRFTPEDFAAYTSQSVGDYAAELFEAGSFDSREDAMARATSQYAELLPDGLATPGEHLWAAYDGDRRVGHLWISVEDDWAFIYDIAMLPEVRGLGYGTEVLALGAGQARALGATHLGLNVFGHNEGAHRLYQRSGFVTTRSIYRLAS